MESKLKFTDEECQQIEADDTNKRIYEIKLNQTLSSVSLTLRTLKKSIGVFFKTYLKDSPHKKTRHDSEFFYGCNDE